MRLSDIFRRKQQELKKEKVEELISLARSYQAILLEVARGQIDAEDLLGILNCVKLDSDYHLGMRGVDYGTDDIGDNSWLYCHQGNEKSYKRDTKFNRKCWPDDFINESYEVFYHMSIEMSEMGAWQAYLLSISPTMLPAVWHGLYNSRRYLYTQEDVVAMGPILHFFPLKRKMIDIKSDLSPKIWIRGKTVYVSCCYWNNWKGVVRETIAFKYKDDRIVSAKREDETIVYRYFNPSRY